MPEYRSYPTVKTENKRKARKRARQETFAYNKSLNNRLRKEKQDAKNEDK